MALVAASCILRFLPLLLLAATEAATFNITNRCSYTVWAAAVPVGGGERLDPGETWTVDVPAGTSGGRVWARTGCSFDRNGGKGRCQTGDCGGVLACTGYGQPPTTIAEFGLGQTNNLDFFDISLVDGFNVPMEFLPARGGAAGCSTGPRCAADITSRCPSQLQAPGGCNHACTVFKQEQYCCTGTVASTCRPTSFSVFFKNLCPDAYSYAQDDDDRAITFTCPSGTDYQVVFCPAVPTS